MITFDDHAGEARAPGADRAGAPDLTYRTVDSPFGALLLAALPSGLARIGFECEGHDAVLQELADTISPRIAESPQHTDGAARQLDEYFAGTRRAFDLDVDLRLSRGFRRSVLEELLAVPYGTTITYTALATAAGRPKAVRAAGTACATNPLPIVVPCHRVLRTDGVVREYLGGTEVKRALLALEAA